MENIRNNMVLTHDSIFILNEFIFNFISLDGHDLNSGQKTNGS